MKNLLKKMKNKEGFTLAELLIVVAIIAVLVAVSIPIFTSQLKKARLATNQANARAAYACVTTAYLTDDDVQKGTATGDFAGTYVVADGKLADSASTTGTELTAAGNNISEWTVDKNDLGTKVYTKWTVTLNSDGTIKSFKAE